MDYIEDKEFTIRLQLRAGFNDDYQGELDGYEWHRHFSETLRPKLIKALFDTLAAEKEWKVTPVSRGTASDEMLELRLDRVLKQ